MVEWCGDGGVRDEDEEGGFREDTSWKVNLRTDQESWRCNVELTDLQGHGWWRGAAHHR